MVTYYNDFRRVGWSVRCIKSAADTCFDPDGDGVCPEDEFSGCMDATACNYNPEATHNDVGSCTYPFSPCCDCDGNDFQDDDSDGVCQCENEIPGCMDASACNYNPEATDEDGSCTYPGVQEWLRMSAGL